VVATRMVGKQRPYFLAGGGTGENDCNQ